MYSVWFIIPMLYFMPWFCDYTPPTQNIEDQRKTSFSLVLKTLCECSCAPVSYCNCDHSDMSWRQQDNLWLQHTCKTTRGWLSSQRKQVLRRLCWNYFYNLIMKCYLICLNCLCVSVTEPEKSGKNMKTKSGKVCVNLCFGPKDVPSLVPVLIYVKLN